MSGVSIEVSEQGAILTAEGLALEPHEQERLHDALRAEVLRIAAARETAPHPVHAPTRIVTETVRTYDPAKFDRDPDGNDDGVPYWVFDDQTRLAGLDACLDCGRDMIAGNSSSVPFAFITCSSIPAGPLQPEDRPCHEGCAVLCGVTRRG